MSFPYFARLMVLVLASFFLIHLALAVALSMMRHSAIRFAGRFRPRQATSVLLGLRLFPTVFAALVVAGLCVPSYLWLEPDAETEAVGLWCLLAAVLGAAVWTISISRGVRAVVKSIRQSRQYEQEGIIEGPIFALAGIIHPRLFISRDVLNALSDEQLSSALEHELAHRMSRDNLKRLLMLLVPDMVPFVRGMRAFDHAWAKFTEWAADDEAVNGNPDRSVTLASTLVQVARLGIAPQTLPLATSLLGADQDLSERVARLLGAQAPVAQPKRGTSAVVVGAMAILFAVVSWSMVQPATLSSVYRLLEQMLR